MVLEARRIFRRGQRYRWANRRLDWISAFERARKDCGTGPGRRRKSLDNQHRDLLRGLSAGRPEFHYHAFEYAHARDDAHAYASDLLGVVYDGHPRAFVVS